MSFGSLLRASTFPKEIILMFMRVFSRIPQTVIFKYEEDLPEAPPNVIIRKWLPQRDLIGITHFTSNFKFRFTYM